MIKKQLVHKQYTCHADFLQRAYAAGYAADWPVT
jgi:hypothetical protein